MKSIIIICFLIFSSCLIKKSSAISTEYIRPIVVPEEYSDTSFILDSKKIYITNEPYYVDSLDEIVPFITELVKDTVLKTTRVREFYSNTSIFSTTLVSTPAPLASLIVFSQIIG